MRRLFLALYVMASCWMCVCAQRIAVNTDVLLDALQTPNLGFEMIAGERNTLVCNIFGNYHPWGHEIKMMGVQPEIRYWPGRRPMHGCFIGAGAIAASYDVHWKGKVYDGYGAGAGLTFGYVFYLSKRINVDVHAGFGAFAYRRKEYYKDDRYDEYYTQGNSVIINATGYYLIPTRIGVSLTYVLK